MYEVDQYTVSLLHFDDGLKDECGKAWTPHGGIAVSTDRKKFGNSSLFLDGVDDYLSMPMISDFSFTGDFTIDAEILIPTDVIIDSSSSAFRIFQIGNHWSDEQFFEFSICDGLVNFLLHDSKGYLVEIWNSVPVEKGVFNHFAVIRKGSQWYGIYNGRVMGSATYDGTFFPNAEVNVGSGTYHGSRQSFKGYIDEFRVSNVARWIMSQLDAVTDNTKISLSWAPVKDAVAYNIKRSTNPGGPYETIATNITSTTYIDDAVTKGITYYYVVTYIDSNGHESMNSNEASATVKAPIEHRLLRITMSDSSEREYNLSVSESEDFVTWYTRTLGTGISCYTFNDIIDGSKEYLSFERIISFKIIPLAE